MEDEEQRRIAEELGIDVEDLTLKPTAKDLNAFPANEASMKSAQLQAQAYPDSDADQMTAKIALLSQSPTTASQIRRQTYNQFKMQHDPRERGMSRRFSEAVQTNDHLDDKHAILHLMFTSEVRRRKMCSFALWGLINVILAIYIIFLLARYWNHWGHSCIGELSSWLLGYLLIHICHIIRKSVCICLWWKAKDPSIQEMQINVFFILFVFLPEIGWYIYGNTFIYNKEEKECREENPEVKQLWLLSLILIGYGYLLMIFFLGIICFAAGAYCLYKSWANLERTDDQ